MLGLGYSPCSKLVSDLLDPAREVGKFERIVGLHGCERRSLAPPAVKELPPRGNAVRGPLRCLSNLQQATGSLLRRAHGVPERPCDSFGASSGVAALAGFEAVAGDAAGPCCFLVVFKGAHVSSIARGAVDTRLCGLRESTLARHAVARLRPVGVRCLPLDYSLSCVSLRSPVPSAFTVYTSRLRR